MVATWEMGLFCLFLVTAINLSEELLYLPKVKQIHHPHLVITFVMLYAEIKLIVE